jgi:hypothetical protein
MREVSMAKIMSTARREYRINHSELRGLARDAVRWRGAMRSEALEQVCRDRAYWLGDRWSLPSSSAGAKAALLVLRDRSGDPLPYLERARALMPADQIPAFLRCRFGIRSMWCGRKAALP